MQKGVTVTFGSDGNAGLASFEGLAGFAGLAVTGTTGSFLGFLKGSGLVGCLVGCLGSFSTHSSWTALPVAALGAVAVEVTGH